MSRDPLTVLLAEDDPLVVELLTRFFRERGHTIHGAAEADAAVALAREVPFDAALVDLNMPGGGRTILDELQAQERFGGPLVVITGDRNPELGDENGKVTRVVRKPFRFRELVTQVEELAGI